MQQFCPKCHYPQTHPFGLTIAETECSGCFTHKEKDTLDWVSRYSKLEAIVKKNKNRTGKYDCVVPVIGDAEDFYTLSKVLELGLTPLVVCVNDYFKNDIGWQNLHTLITHFDVDSFVFNPDIRVYKDLVRTSLRKYDHMMLPFLQLHTSFPVHVAYERKIPMIIWGQNQSVEQVGKFSHLDSVEMSRWNRRQHDLFNIEVDSLIGNGAQVDLRYLNYYQYPNVQQLSRRGIKGIYLSNYMRWDPLEQNKKMISNGFQPESNKSSFDVFERAGSSVYYHLHDILKLKRVGFRKISDHVAREIRHGRITFDEGKSLINVYNKQPVFIKPFFDWLGVTKSGYEWFKIHRLKGFEDVIVESNENINQINITLPEALNNMVLDSQIAQEHHVIYGKGISI